MLTISQLCSLRSVVFDPQKRDTVLDLSDLISGRIDPDVFFEENYITEGMRGLLEHAFRRLEGQSEQGVFLLKQAMGGGKTHNLLSLGLLAQHPEYRKRVMGGFHHPDPDLGPVQVIAFSGRETDAPYGIWGALAEQLGQKELFRELYSPLRAPGQKAWENLFRGQRVLILLDELPPYFQSAKSVQVGNSDLAQVTATALSNLLVAIGRPGCERVALVITDLAATYREGSAQIAEVLHDLENETGRTAMSLEPVRLNSDELYHILRTRLFEKVPPEEKIGEVAQAYAEAIRKAKQMDMTSESPEEFAARVMASYPFHPGIRDLYARFRENPGFQQTRGLIRLMRLVAANLWATGKAKDKLLIGVHDVDLNQQQIRAEVGQISSSLGNAIAHDIAAEGSATAELLDAEYDSHDATDAGKLLLMASLANVPNAVRGLAIPEIITHLAEPGRDAARLKNEVLPALATQAWYMHSTRDGKLYVRDVQNLNARLETLVKAYVDEQALKELRERLEGLFRPEVRDVYQRVQVFPAIDAIEPEQDRVTLVIARPSAGGLDPDVIKFYEQATWKNRLAFLSGPRNTYNDLVNIGKRLRAVGQIVKELTEERTPESDPQMIQAEQLRDRHTQNFHSAVRETFTTLWYPTGEALASSDFHMRFGSNRYDGEEQVRSLLGEKMKFTDDVSGETFRKKCEQRLFTQQAMPWVEVKRRAATNTGWQWHIPSALEDLKTECLFRDVWREENGYVDKGPFERPKTDVSVRELTRDDTTGKVLLRLTPVHGDTLYWEVGSGASTASARLEGSELRSSALRLSFLCVDSTGEHETGEPVTWQNRITLKHRIFQAGDERMMELQAAPMAHVHYTTDGSDPKLAGARYADPFALPQSATVVLAYAERDGVASEVLNVPVERPGRGPGPQVHVDPRLPARLERRQETHSTQDTYAWIEKQEKHRGRPAGLTVTSGGSGRATEWAQLVTSEKVSLSTEQLVEALGLLRRVQGEGQVMMEVQAVCYPTGQDLLDWVAAERTELQPGEVQQKS